VAISKSSGKPVRTGRRVGAALIDVILVPVISFFGIGLVVGRAFHAAPRSHEVVVLTYGWSLTAMLLGWLAYPLWNWGYRQGKTGSTIGNSILKFEVVRAATGQPIGLGVKRVTKIVAATLIALPLVFVVADAVIRTYVHGL
jgi:RDD family